MKLVQINWSPDRRQLRQFGLFSLVALPGLGWLWNAPVPVMNGLLAAGIAAALVAVFKPQWLKLPFIGLSLITIPIGLVVSELTLLMMFLGVFLPIGMVFRMVRRDSLQLRAVSTASYWRPKARPSGAASYYKQW